MRSLKLLHAADLHLDSPFEGLGAAKAAQRRQEQRQLLYRIAQLAQSEQVDLVLLAGDLLDSDSSYAETAEALSEALGSIPAPVFISPGNHDFYSQRSAYARVSFPENVHIFKKPELECVELAKPNVRVWGAAFCDKYSEGLLHGFSAEKSAGMRDIMCIHGEVAAASSYDPISEADIAASGMDYIALGHIHKASGLKRSGTVYYAWPGCPEGRGFDETGEKYVYIVSLDSGCTVKPVCLAQRKYEILNVELNDKDAADAALAALPENTGSDVYRIVLRGEASEPPQTEAVKAALENKFFALQVRDETVLKRDIWQSAQEDNLRGQFLKRLKAAYDAAAGDAERERISQAARWGLAALDNREEVVRHDDKKLDATFGKLEGESLELHEGLNVISAPNESGKSTWCAFIRAMLYGIDSSERQKAGFLPDKMRYAPWSGASMQGSMRLESAGRDITIVRTTKTASAPMREFSAVYTGTNTPVEGLSGSNAGQELTGVSREVFRRSAFIEQGGIAVTHSAELEKRISAIVSTGEEDCSYTEADGRLRQWQRKRRFNRYGRLPELEDELSHKKQLLSELTDASAKREDMSAELEAAKKECERLEAEVVESRKAVRKEALSSLQGVRNDLNSATERHDKAVERRDACRAALGACAIGERKPEEAKAEVKADLAEAMKLKEKSERRSSPALAVILLLLCGALVAAGFLLKDFMIHSFVAAFLALAAGVILLVRTSRLKTEAYAAAKDRRSLLAKYRAESEEDIASSLDEYLELYKSYTEAQRTEKETADILSMVRRRQEQAEKTTLTQLDFTGGDNQAAQLSRRLNEARAKCSRISALMAERSGRLAAMGDPLVLGSEISRMEEEHAEISAEYEAIALAIDTLRKANEDIQGRFSPALGKLAAEYMDFVTGGRYDGVMLDRDFSATVHEKNADVPRNAEYLSTGTLDLMYLAVRLAVCELALPEDANCPLIIDDSLVNYDADRRERTMALLEKIAQRRQVVLFTCN